MSPSRTATARSRARRPSSSERELVVHDQLGIAGFHQLGHYHYQRARQRLQPHDHGPLMEICYLASGEQRYVVGGQSYHLRGGECYCTFPGEPHSTGGQREQRGMLYWLLLDCAHPAFLNLPATDARALGGALTALPQRHFPAPRLARQQLDMVRQLALRGHDPLQRIRAATCLQRFCCDLVEASLLADRPDCSPAIRRALDLIENELHGILPVAMLARTADLSESRFKTRFREEIGMPPAEWVLRRKLGRAQSLLHSGRSVTAIAADLGFSSSQYFATVFKRHVGCSPSAWLAEQESPHA